MTYTIIISDLATITTEYNLAFLKAFNHNYSLKTAERINCDIKKLETFPHAHSIYKKTYTNIYRKLLIKGVFNVIYTVTGNTIIILYTTDARKSTDEYFSYLK